MLYRVGECIFLLSFCHFKWLSWGALFWPLFTYLDRVTAAPPSSPLISQTTCFNFELEFSFRTSNEPWSAPTPLLRYSLLVFISAVLFTVFLFMPSITWPWHVVGCSTDRTSETCKYLKDFSEISPSHTDLCIKLKKRWMSAGWCCHRTAVCTVCAHQSKSCPFPSGVMTMRWRQKHNTPMKCNQTEVSMNVMSVRKKRLQSNIINMLTMYVHAY